MPFILTPKFPTAQFASRVPRTCPQLPPCSFTPSSSFALFTSPATPKAALRMASVTTTKIAAGAPFPSLNVRNLAGETVDISKPAPGFDWKLLIVYRGAHCPLCTKYLKSLAALVARFNAAKVDVAVVSADSEAQLQSHMQDLPVDLPMHYGMTVEQMQELGLYVSHPRSEKETDHPFSEPGLFVINDKAQVQVLDISNAPFARPDLASLAFGIEYVRGNDYPIRGTYA